MSIARFSSAAPPLLVFFAAALFFVARVEVGPIDPRFHVDEAHKLGETYFYHLFFEEGDFRNPAWQEDFYARTNPPVGKYVFGAALSAAGFEVPDSRYQDAFVRLWRDRPALRRQIPDGMLRVTRTTSAIFAALTATLLFLVVRRVGGTAAGLLSTLILFSNGLFLDSARRGMTDTILLFFLVLAPLVSLRAVDMLERAGSRPDPDDSAAGGAPKRREQLGALALWTVIVPGVSVGLATGVKLNGALTGLVYGGAVLVGTLLARKRNRDTGAWSWKISASAITSAGLLSLVVFVGLNPFFWEAPLIRIGETPALYGDWMRGQQLDPGYALFGIAQRFVTLAFHSLLSPQLVAVRSLGSVGALAMTLGCLLGLATLVQRMAKGRSAGNGREVPASSDPARAGVDVAAGVLLIWALVTNAAVAFWLPLDWSRYMLPPFLGTAMLCGVGLWRLLVVAGGLGVALFEDRRAANRWREARGVVLGLALAAALVLSPWPLRRELLDPAHFDHDLARYRRVADGESDSPVPWRNLGRALTAGGQPVEAIRAFESALSRTPGFAPPYESSDVLRAILLWELAVAQARSGRTESARETFSRHLESLAILRDAMHSDDPEIRNKYGEVEQRRRSVFETLVSR